MTGTDSHGEGIDYGGWDKYGNHRWGLPRGQGGWGREDISREESLKNPPQIVVVGSTYFPGYNKESERSSGGGLTADDVRGDLVSESLKELVLKRGVNVHIIDGGSPKFFIDGVAHSLGGFYSDGQVVDVGGHILRSESREKSEPAAERGKVAIRPQMEKGYSAARVEGIRSVIEDWRSWDVLVQMELEKTPMVSQLPELSKPILTGKADITIPDRGIRSVSAGDDYDDFRGYPPEQAESERKQNKLIHEMLVRAGLRQRGDPVLDLLGGTRAIAHDPDLIAIFGTTCYVPEDSEWRGTVKPQVYLNAVYSPVYIALAGGYKVISVDVEYTHPAEQTKTEISDPSFSEKRISQYNDIVNGSEFMIGYLAALMSSKNGKEVCFDSQKFLEELTKHHPENMQWTGRLNKLTAPVAYGADYNLRPAGLYPIEEQFKPRRIFTADYLSSFH